MRLVKEKSSEQGKEDWKKETFSILKSKNAKIFYAVIIGIVFLRLGVNWIFKTRQHEEIPHVTILQPTVGTMDKILNMPGNIEALEQASLFAHVNGYLKKIYVDEGDHVKKGQLLAVIDAPDIVQEFNKAKAEFELKDITFKRYQELLKEQVVSEQEFDNVQADANEAKARFDNASANLSYTHITAPFSGSIARRFKYPGDLISSNSRTGSDQPIFILVNEESLRVAINVPQIEVANIHLGDIADIHVDAFADRKFEGTVTRLDALMDDATKTQRVLIELENKDGALHAGMFASASLHIKEIKDAISIPEDCVVTDNGKSYVFVEKDKKAFKKEVTLGMELNGAVQIVQGVAPGDHVIRLGSSILKDGSAVIPQ
jgi:membrane fusion protein (multidrug efflux system)